MKLTTYSNTPKSLLQTIMDENFFEDFLNPFGNRALTNIGYGGPLTNIADSDEEICMSIAVPGLKKEDIKIVVNNKTITIQHNNEYQDEQKSNTSIRKEWGYNSFSRSFKLPENSLEEGIESKLENGILTIKIPKSKTSEKIKLIDIQ